MYCSHHILLVSNKVVHFDKINYLKFYPYILKHGNLLSIYFEKILVLSMFRQVEKYLVYQKVFSVSIDHWYINKFLLY
jgi:hypothetical protein